VTRYITNINLLATTSPVVPLLKHKPPRWPELAAPVKHKAPGRRHNRACAPGAR